MEGTYQRAGVVESCVTRGYQKCDPSDSTECVGEPSTNFVYGVELPGILLTDTDVMLEKYPGRRKQVEEREIRCNVQRGEDKGEQLSSCVL